MKNEIAQNCYVAHLNGEIPIARAFVLKLAVTRAFLVTAEHVVFDQRTHTQKKLIFINEFGETLSIPKATQFSKIPTRDIAYLPLDSSVGLPAAQTLDMDETLTIPGSSQFESEELRQNNHFKFNLFFTVMRGLRGDEHILKTSNLIEIATASKKEHDINAPGMSGAPLVGKDGVVGMNTGSIRGQINIARSIGLITQLLKSKR